MFVDENVQKRSPENSRELALPTDNLGTLVIDFCEGADWSVGPSV